MMYLWGYYCVKPAQVGHLDMSMLNQVCNKTLLMRYRWEIGSRIDNVIIALSLYRLVR